jgi:hypothetical protein
VKVEGFGVHPTTIHRAPASDWQFSDMVVAPRLASTAGSSVKRRYDWS